MTPPLSGSAMAGQAGEWTPGPWPWAYSGDGKRIVIGEGLVEGPEGYEVAEVYSDDCPQAIAEANARLIAAAPEVTEGADFLLARIAELDWSAGWESFQRDWHGHVEPAIARLRSATAKARGASK